MSINFEDLFSSSLTDQPAVPTQSNQVDWDGYFGTEFKQQKQADVGLVYGELSKQLGDGTYKKSLVDLEKDKEYQQIAGDFLRDIGESGDDIFEYMRDEDFNLVDGFQRWADATNLSDINKQRYAYLRTAFDNASLGSFGQGMELVKEAAEECPEILSLLKKLLDGMEKIFTQRLQQALKDKQFTGDAKRSARYLVAITRGIAVIERVYGDKKRLTEIYKTALDNMPFTQ